MHRKCGVVIQILAVLVLSGLIVSSVHADELLDKQGGFRPGGFGKGIDPEGGFEKIWESSYGFRSMALAVGDLDDDGLLEFVWSDGYSIFLVESDGADGYVARWNSIGMSDRRGVITAIAYGDTDGDGLPEIILNRVSTGPYIEIYEKSPVTGDYSTMITRFWGWVRDMGGVNHIFVADTNGNGKMEIILNVTNGTTGMARHCTTIIMEYDDSQEDHRFTRVFKRSHFSSREMSIGDLDHDGIDDISLGIYGIWFFWLEYDSAEDTWIKKSVTMGAGTIQGVPLVADIDSNGENDLFMKTDVPVGFLMVDSTGNDELVPREVPHESIYVYRVRDLAVSPQSRSSHRRGYLATLTEVGYVAVWKQTPNRKDLLLIDSFAASPHYDPGQLAIAEAYPGGPLDVVVSSRRKVYVYRQQETGLPGRSTGEQSVSMSDAFPNPFNPMTNVPITVNEESQVTIRIYDVSGRLVTTLLDRVLPQGKQMVSWDATGFGSGTYFLKLESGGKIETRKLLLVK